MSVDQVLIVPLRARIAWSACCVERVLSFYSLHFRQTYFQTDAVNYAWEFAIEGERNLSLRDEIVAKIEGKYNDEKIGRGEGYGAVEIFMGMELLDEIKYDYGKSAVAAVEFARAAFAYQRLYRAGLTYADPRVSSEVVDALGDRIFDFAVRTLDYITAHRDIRIERSMFDWVPLDRSFKPFSLDALSADAYVPMPPPRHERAHQQK